ncbi:MAG TPA: acyl-CoA synthetase [Gemmatimonadota bacterium]|nr:acyl-CoA synthetase [Gemmatimonadota bacterium]
MTEPSAEAAPPPVARAAAHVARTAIIDAEGGHTYAELLAASSRIATRLLSGSRDLDEARVAFLAPAGFSYVATLWGIWRAGGVAVPLSPSYPAPELATVLDDAWPAAVLADRQHAEILRPLAQVRGIRLATVDQALREEAPGMKPTGAGWAHPAIDPGHRAMILYTSGTTNRPKGVVLTHANLAAQIESLIEAWEWTADDRILHVLPLHHTHGIINALLCPLQVGATCEMMPAFAADAVWRRFAQGGITIFMAVPTIYVRLIAAWEAAPPDEQARMSAGCRAMRVMISGSAALPVRVFDLWRGIAGHDLLERYGMTELGMALSNPLRGERRPGAVGTPLPGVEVRLVGEDGREVPEGSPGELRVRGENVFLGYWDRPEATREAFEDGWFRTGDQAVFEDGAFRILGRSSIDILKTGGYKISALEIEEALREHPAIAECAIVGVPDPEWGERVCAAIIPASGSAGALSLEEVRDWARERLAPYKLPSRLLVVDDLPRNAMGKVTKTALRPLFEAQGPEAE